MIKLPVAPVAYDHISDISVNMHS